MWLAALLLVAVSCSDTSDIADRTSSDNAPAAAQSPDTELSDSGLSDTGLSDSGISETEAPSSETSEAAADDSAAAPPADSGASSELAALITELPSAPVGAPEPEARQARPTGLTIESLGVETAAVIGVGIEPNGDMEVPPADQVGWYQYGPTPGQEGSSVLAAHIAYDGRNGVFVSLDQIEIGSTIEVGYDDGTTRRFEATEIQQYDKNELPTDSVWGRTGEPQLVLITCGGDFNRNLRSYEDNVVVYARPLT